MSELRIMLLGRIIDGQEIDWHISPLVFDALPASDSCMPILPCGQTSKVDEDEEYQCEEHKLENPTHYADYPSTDEVATLQDAIDFGEHTAEYEDWLEDVEWMRRGM